MSEQKPIILHGVMSPNVVKVAIMLEELELPYVLKHVALFKGEQFTPEFLALNPVGKVPVIEDPALGRPLAESGAILIWLAEQHGKFLPARSADRYEVLQWLMVQMAGIGPMLGQYTHFRLLPEGSEPYALGRYAVMAKRFYQLIDDRVADREWIASDAYSIADIATFPWAEYLERHGLSIDSYPAMRRWREAIAYRPAVRRAKARIVEEFAAPSATTMTAATTSDLDRFFGRTDEVPVQDFTSVKRMS
ncbi:GST-like protein [Novosphingobium sp. PhB165]|uniref:glutathione S-transferase family protein n=1 Tax=Novosphingobium sp. PhB165 TaxID=2485105 RepID=UPI0010DEB59E|nr:glutathione S-transferase N-terminal domain-containing protein [Novosphingobium sp. PhB165]TCM16443.1 GST-like protein [Novosphingobium sp. PhB165]